MVGSKQLSSPSPISIGNCKVEIEGDGFSRQSPDADSLIISFSDAANIKITVNDSGKYTMRKPQYNGEEIIPIEAHSFLLVNPKDIDSRNKSFVQEILKIYMNELPSMNFAANTGKESSFLERCVSNGKYKSLVLRSNSVEGYGEVMAAISYQIIPADTQFAEIPLAAVRSNYQKKGIGCLLYEELRKRLQNVGVLTIFCWADKESEGFWLKQGFVSIGEVDNRGRACRLPIKADIQRALCFPGGSTLMVAHLRRDFAIPAISLEMMSIYVSSKLLPKGPIVKEGCCDTFESDFVNEQAISPASQGTKMNILKISQIGGSLTKEKKLDGCNETSVAISEGENKSEAGDLHCSCSGQNAKKRVWEASISSLKSKRVKGSHDINCGLDPKINFCYKDDINNVTSDDFSLSDESKTLVEIFPKVSRLRNSIVQTETSKPGNNTTQQQSSNKHNCKGVYPNIMFMNIADPAKRTSLTKIVEELGGSVTCDGGVCTHVITGRARRTLNFCIALCSGAWIVSSNWLKESFREGKFVDESAFLLEDSDYASKYKSELKEAIAKARSNPCALLKRYQICIAKHVQPSVGTLSAIIETAGGDVIRTLCSMKQPSETVFVACEEDMEDALVAAKKGVWTYSSEWLMSCIMKQELDFEAPQFAESL